MTNEISDQVVYANLQMAAESVFLPSAGQIPVSALTRGNDRSSKTPTVIAEQIAKDWTIAAHIENTTTGLSATLFKSKTGEYVMSIRSTEFIDDAVRDNKATNELEVKDTGFAIGQLADLEKWYQESVKPLTAGGALTVTGYSLGGHLATAFEQLHRSEVVQGYCGVNDPARAIPQ